MNGDVNTISRSGVTVATWAELQTSSHAERLPPLPATRDLGVRGKDPVMIFFSSGTTGPQKAVMLSHRNIHAQYLISWLVTDISLSLFTCGQ